MVNAKIQLHRRDPRGAGWPSGRGGNRPAVGTGAACASLAD